MAANGENQEEFKERERFQHLLEEHIKRQSKKIPEHGSYANPYPVEEPRDIVGFDKMIGRETEKVDPEADIEGDILILNPDKIGKHLPDIKFDK
jgi:hypothetical protein